MIILNEKIESKYKNFMSDSLAKFSKELNLIKLKYLSIVICGKSGVGKSTLINCLLKELLAKEGEYDVTTLERKMYFNNIKSFLFYINWIKIFFQFISSCIHQM